MIQFKHRTILITGGTGSWGNELVTQLLSKEPKQIIIYSRGEFAQVTMQRKFNDDKLKFIIGDVRDLESLTNACKGVDVVFHLAALKHIPVCEDYPYEAIKTNLQGTENVIKATMANKVRRVIDVSTDKACVPINLYGLTKAAGEKLIIHADSLETDTIFTVVRGGNVLGSNGSVIPHFIKQIQDYNQITVTDERMTRYFLTLPEAINLLFVAAQSNIPGGIFVMKMPAFKIKDIAQVLIKLKGNDQTEIKYTGIRQGEKLHESLVSTYESPNTYVYGENFYLIHSLKQNLPKVDFEEYHSNADLKDESGIVDLLKAGHYIN